MSEQVHRGVGEPSAVPVGEPPAVHDDEPPAVTDVVSPAVDDDEPPAVTDVVSPAVDDAEPRPGSHVEAPPVRVTGPMFRRAALTPRMLALLLVFLAIAAVCARLGVWQLDRAGERAAINEAARAAQQLDAPATPLGDVLVPQQTFPGDLVGTKVEVTGRFDGATLLVPGREGPTGDVGFLVLDRFVVTDDGSTDGAGVPADAGAGDAPDPGAGGILPVVRGWVPEATAPEPAAGEVTVRGFLQAGESFEQAVLPEGQVAAVAPGQLVNLWGGPVYTGYLVVDEPVDAGVDRLPPPTLPGGGLDLQNLAYALQWWIFGGFAVLLWSRLVRDEARAEAEDLAAAEERTGPARDRPHRTTGRPVGPDR